MERRRDKMKYSMTHQDDLDFLNLHNVEKGIKMLKVSLQTVVLMTVAFCMVGTAFGGAQKSPLVAIGTISFIDEQAQQFGMKLTEASTKSANLNLVVDEVVFKGIPTILSDNKPIHPRDVPLGVEAILVLSADGSGRPVLYVPPRGSQAVLLRAWECSALGGRVANDAHCPLVEQADGQLTRTTCLMCGLFRCNSLCIDEAD
jgi:hypothetical protein